MIYNVLQYLEKSVERFPDKVAFEDDIDCISYRDFQRKAMQIGSFLKTEYNVTNRPVAVLIDRNINSILAFIGVVYSGNFYVPVDSTMPEERVNLILRTLEPFTILDARRKQTVQEHVHTIDDILKRIDIASTNLSAVRRTTIDTDPLYAIFTSGSTGIPKGVVVSHRSVIDLVEAFDEAFSFDDTLVFGNQAPFDFDVSVKDIYNSIRCGATMQILPKKLFRMPKLLIEYLTVRNVDTLIWAVSALRLVSDFKTFDAVQAPKLKYVMFSGEVMPIRALNYWMKHVPEARYVNLYGPTEITCNCTYFEIRKPYSEEQVLPIGKAFANTRVLLQDENGNWITGVHQIGEICVTGSCLALGYWNNPQKTQEAFVRNTSITAYESRMYATGDLGYYNEEGDIVFASRKDFQIKHMGHRIELGEIEVALNAIPFLTVSCCLYDKVAEKIICLYQSPQECKTQIISALSKKLPKYMWPNVFIHYEALPLNKNGKIDRVLLAEKHCTD